jgi:hypothetical protein
MFLVFVFANIISSYPHLSKSISKKLSKWYSLSYYLEIYLHKINFYIFSISNGFLIFFAL